MIYIILKTGVRVTFNFLKKYVTIKIINAKGNFMKKKLVILAFALSVAMSGCSNANDTDKASVAKTTTVKNTYDDIDAEKYITKIGEYKGLEYKKIEVEPVTEEEIKYEVDNFLSNNPEKITDREVKEGDVVNIDYVGKKDGVAFAGGTANGYDLKIGSHSFIDGFEEGLVGHKPGEEVSLNLTFPENYREGSDLNGAKVVFDVKINYISVTPEKLTEKLVKEKTEYSTVKEYKESIKKEIEATKLEDKTDNTKTELMNKIVDTTEIKELPKELVDEFAEKYKDYTKNIAAMYGMELDAFITDVMKKTKEEYDKIASDYGTAEAKITIIIKYIADKENIEVTEKDYKEGLEKYYKLSGASAEIDIETYEKEKGIELGNIILYDKVMDFIMKNGKAI